ncbi:MAG: response regulator transcription factor [Pseudomonadota bacterium]
MRFLVVEDDDQVRGYVEKGLSEAGHNVDAVDNGKDGLFLATTENYDALVVDWMLPAVDGITLLNALRASDARMPALMLSDRSDVDDRVRGLRSGADDYLIKPFAFEELLARLEVLAIRRNLAETPNATLQCGDLHMHLLKRQVCRANRRIDLNPREFALLECLLLSKEQVVTRTMLLEKVWNYHFDPQTNVIDVHISRLRSKVDKGHDQHLIHTVRGAGYKISDAA